MEEDLNDIPAPQTEEQEQAEKEKPVRPQTVVTQEMLDKSSKTLATMLDYLGLDATVRSEGRTSKINLIVASEDAGRIIGRKGQSLESLQLLLNRMMQKSDVDFPKIYIDIDGYSSKQQRGDDRRSRGKGGDRDREDRKEKSPHRERSSRSRREDGESSSHDDILRQQALDAAKELRRWGEPVSLPEMNAHDRRIIHITLEGEADIQTESRGDGAYKSVVVSLKKAE